MCERSQFLCLCSRPGSGVEVVAREVEIQGYRVAVLREWALNRARYLYSIYTCGGALVICAVDLDTNVVSCNSCVILYAHRHFNILLHALSLSI